MKAQMLRNAVLQLAIQGNLVPQDPADEPASILIKRIKAEKDKLIKDKKTKKQKPLSAIIDDEKTFDIPDNWEWVRLGAIGIVQTGTTPPKTHPEYFKGEIPFIKPGDISGDKIDYCNEKLSQMGLEKGRSIPSYSIMMVCIGGSIGKSYFTERLCSCNQQINAITPLCSISYLFLHYFMKSFYFTEYVRSQSTGTATPIINKSKWENLIIPLPPVQEQKRIVDKLEETMPLIDEYEKLETELTKLEDEFPEKLGKSILQYAVQGKLVEQNSDDEPASILLERVKAEKEQLIKDKKIKKQKELPPITDGEKPFDIPESWEWVRIPNVTFFQEGPGIMRVDFRNHGVPLIRISGMHGNIVSLEGCNFLEEGMVEKKWSHFKLDLADLIVTSSATMGKIAKVDEETVGSIPYTGLIRFKMSNAVIERYFINFIRSSLFKSQIDKQKAGTTIKHFGPSHLKRMLIPIPPLAEQQRIVEIIDVLLELCDILSDEKALKSYNVKTENKNVIEAEFGKSKTQEESGVAIAARGKINQSDLEIAKELFEEL